MVFFLENNAYLFKLIYPTTGRAIFLLAFLHDEFKYFPMTPYVCLLDGMPDCHNSLKGQEVNLPCSCQSILNIEL